MTFLNPAAFLLLLTIPVVILFHLLKIRRQQAVVSSTLLWADSLRDLEASAPFRRLKPNLLLLLQILAILLLALALAKPVRTVIATGHEARVLVPFTEEKRVLRQAIQALEALDVEGRLTEALRLAQANLQQGGRPAVGHVFTHGAFDTPEVPDPQGAAVRWHRFAQRSRNVGITAFETRKAYFGAFDYQAFLSVANYSGEAQTFELTLALDGQLLK